MKRMKKFLIKSICLLLVTITTFSLCGCFSFERKEFDVGDFRVQYQRKGDEKDPNSYLYLLGLSKAGEQKETIVLPKKINGHPYYLEFLRSGTVFQGKMEKFYFEYPGQYSQNLKEPILQIGDWYIGYLKKVITNIDVVIRKNGDHLNFYNYYVYCKKMQDSEKEDVVVGSKWRLANLQLLYNYDNSPNEGYFWIDDIDNGETVEIIPDIPEREGYTFEGWYTEKECIDEFDFNTVFNKPVLEVGETYPEDYVTYLYAKWIKD